mgnify:CR=1 FL=1
MRIRLVTYSTKPRGGVVHALCLAEALTDRGHDVELWALSADGAAFFREPRPEEFNRRVTGLICDHHFAPTEFAADNLRKEGVDAASISQQAQRPEDRDAFGVVHVDDVKH